jgi:S1-C subfamily serine protease
VQSRPVVEPTHGYAGWESTFDALRRETDRVYFDADTQPLQTRVVVESVVPGLPADVAGVVPGDVILAYNDVTGTSPRLSYERIRLMELDQPPTQVIIKLLRGESEKSLEIDVGWLGVQWSDYAVTVAVPSDADVPAGEAEDGATVDEP